MSIDARADNEIRRDLIAGEVGIVKAGVDPKQAVKVVEDQRPAIDDELAGLEGGWGNARGSRQQDPRQQTR